MSSSLLPEHLARSVRPVQWQDAAFEVAAPLTDSPLPRFDPPAPPPIPIEELKREAYQRGLQDGEQRATDQAAARIQPVLQNLSKTLATLVDLRQRVRRDSEGELVQLSIAIARRILNRELTVDPTAIHGLLKAALDKAQSREICRIQLHPDQEVIIRSCLEPLLPGRRIELVTDGALRPWEILIEAQNGGWLDASIETQLKEVERGLADRLAR